MSARAVGCGTQLSNARQRRNTLRKGKVGFNTVEIRECRPLLGGGGGIPTAGSPLGMGWEVERQTRIDVDCFESWRDGGEGGQACKITESGRNTSKSFDFPEMEIHTSPADMKSPAAHACPPVCISE